MKRQLWAFIDTKTHDILGMVMMVSHIAEIERIAMDALSNPRSVLRRYPQDFKLVKLAELTTTAEGMNLTPTLGEHELDIVELANKTEVDYHTAAAAEQHEKEARAAYDAWAAQQMRGNEPQETEKHESLLKRIFGGNK